MCKNSWSKISSKFNLFKGSNCNNFVINDFAWLLITTCSGNVYAHIRILLYVVLTSDVSNGGFPVNKVNIITPNDQISTSNECPVFPSIISGAI